MPQNMRGNARHNLSILTDKFFLHLTHIVLKVHPDFRLTILIKKQETAVTVNNLFYFRAWTIFKHSLEGPTNLIGKGNIPKTAFCLWLSNKIRLVCCPAKLLVNADISLIKINVCFCKSIKLRYP